MKKIKFAANLKHLRTLKGLTQKDMAKKMGFTQGGVSNIESQKAVPSINFLDAAKRIFKINTEDLMYTDLRKTVKSR